MKTFFYLMLTALVAIATTQVARADFDPKGRKHAGSLAFTPLNPKSTRVYLINRHVDKAECVSRHGFWYGKVCNKCPVGK
ncbi:MAG: hypothetical protein HY074_13065, partial [Deltaproteobacteria bacterium]|nr:hypothetical protein [Deltaproteobacteria bacterium]